MGLTCLYPKMHFVYNNAKTFYLFISAAATVASLCGITDVHYVSKENLDLKAKGNSNKMIYITVC